MTLDDYTVRTVTPSSCVVKSNIHQVTLESYINSFVDGACKDGHYVFIGINHSESLVIVHTANLIDYDIIEYNNVTIYDVEGPCVPYIVNRIGLDWKSQYPIIWFENLLLTFACFNPITIIKTCQLCNSIVYYNEGIVLTETDYIEPYERRIPLYGIGNKAKILKVDSATHYIYNIPINKIIRVSYGYVIGIHEYPFRVCNNTIIDMTCVNGVIFAIMHKSSGLAFKQPGSNTWDEIDLKYKDVNWKRITSFNNKLILVGTKYPDECRSCLAYSECSSNDVLSWKWKFVDRLIGDEHDIFGEFRVLESKSGLEKLICSEASGHSVICNLGSNEFNYLRCFPIDDDIMISRMYNPKDDKHVCVTLGKVCYYAGRSI